MDADEFIINVIDIKWSLGYKEPTLWWAPEDKKGK